MWSCLDTYGVEAGSELGALSLDMDTDVLLAKLMSFEGLGVCRKRHKGFYTTTGVRYLANQVNCYWLIDLIYRNLPNKPQRRDIVVCRFYFDGTMGRLVMEDYVARTSLEVSITNVSFPFAEMPLYCEPVEDDWILMLLHRSLTSMSGTLRG